MQKKTKESKISNFIGIILIIICIPLLIIVVTIAIKANINHNKLPDFLGYKPLICASNSMSNIFELGDLTITKQVSENKLAVGDIITFWDSKHNIVITHRIEEISIAEDGTREYTTKGDMNNSTDKEKVKYEQIEGKCIYYVKYIGNLILALQKPTWLIIAFLIPLIIYANTYRRKLKKEEIKEQRKEKLLRKIQGMRNQRIKNIANVVGATFPTTRAPKKHPNNVGKDALVVPHEPLMKNK